MLGHNDIDFVPIMLYLGFLISPNSKRTRAVLLEHFNSGIRGPIRGKPLYSRALLDCFYNRSVIPHIRSLVSFRGWLWRRIKNVPLCVFLISTWSFDKNYNFGLYFYSKLNNFWYLGGLLWLKWSDSALYSPDSG